MLKKIIAATAVAGAMGLAAPSASAALLCVDVYLDLNGTVVAQVVCTPA